MRLVGVFLVLTLAVSAEAQQYFSRIYNLSSGFPNAQVWDIVQDPDGFVWFATGAGAVRYTGRGYQTLDKDDGFVGNVARSILMDSSGRMWITFDEGVSSVSGSTIRNYTHQEGFPKGIIREAEIDRWGRIWFVSSDDGMAILSEDSVARITESNGFPTDHLRSVYRDESGNMWVGGQHGVSVLRWNGRRYEDEWQHFLVGQSPIPGSVVEITNGRGGELAICTQNGLLLVDLSKWQSNTSLDKCSRLYDVKDGLAHSYVSDVVADGPALWVSTDYGLTRLENGKGRKVTFDESLTTNSLTSLLIDRSGILWIGTDGGGMIKMPNRTVEHYTTRDGLLSNIVNAIETDSKGRVFIANDNGVNVLHQGHVTRLIEEDRFRGDAIWSLDYAPTGELWIGSERGLFLYRDGRLRASEAVNVIRDATITDIERDHAGRVWIGTTNGIAVLDGGRSYVYQKEQGLTSNQIWSIFHASDGSTWIATSDGLLRWSGREPAAPTFDVWQKQHGLPDNYVNVVNEYPRGTLWIGTDAGLSRLAGTEFVNYGLKARKLLRDNRITVIQPDSTRNGLWVGSSGFVLLEVNGRDIIPKELWTARTGLVGDESTTHNSLLTTPAGEVYVGSYNGLTRIMGYQNVPLPTPRLETVRVQDTLVVQSTLSEPEIEGKSVEFTFSCPYYFDEESVQFLYVLDGFETDWSIPSNQNSVRYTNLPPGNYSIRFRVSSVAKGLGPESEYRFSVRTPWWRRWFVWMVVSMMVGWASYKSARQIIRKRLHRVEAHNRELEKVVQLRTMELLQQKENLESLLAELQKTQTQLIHSEKMAALGQLVAGVAHEINNPTSILAGNVGYVEDYINGLRKMIAFYERRLDPQHAFEAGELKNQLDYDFMIRDVDHLLSSFKHAADRIRDIVQDLRTFSRPDELDISEVDIHECLDTTITLFLNQYRLLLTIEREFKATRKVLCAANQINQVLLNLLVNSAHAIEKKFSGASGKGIIRVGTKDVDTDKIEIRIWDNGTGISQDIIPRIFDPFFTTKPVGHGTGLGLSISYGIIERHVGSIRCMSEEGQWTEFLIVLPRNGLNVS